ncbi:hypothetical protein QBC45DRAFT_444601 [Copromyces sp. CBS 386.78]|nr:hypothetical protein QBC45DRAFT_444601 [Copromyces sp. CBS 386.78]
MLALNSLSYELFLLVLYATYAHAFDISQFLSGHSHDTEEMWTGLAPAWVSSPNARGTGDILFSCLTTLAACAYTAVHPIIPPGGESTRNFTIIKYLLVLVAVMAPEAVVAFAVQEFYDAWRLKKKLQGIIKRTPCEHHQKPDKNQPRVSVRNPEKKLECPASHLDLSKEVNMTFCFFVVMSGLQVDISGIKPSHYVRYSHHADEMPSILPLSVDGVIELAELGHLCKLIVPHSVIDDKSKGALLQKALVLIQVLWMAIQCIARSVAGFPISLLELHTFGHVLFTLLMYGFWFWKPLDIKLPEVKPTDGFEDVLALMLQEHSHSPLPSLPHNNPESTSSEPEIPPSTSPLSIDISTHDHSISTDLEDGNSVENRLTTAPSIAGRRSIPYQDDEPLLTSCTISNTTVCRTLEVGDVLQCGFAHYPVVNKRPSWRVRLSGDEEWPTDIPSESGPDNDSQWALDSKKPPILLTSQDLRRARKAARFIYQLDAKEGPPTTRKVPYSRARFGSTGQHCRYPNKGYKSAFQSLRFEIRMLYRSCATASTPASTTTTEPSGGSDSDVEVGRLPIHVVRQNLCREAIPLFMTKWAAYLDLIFLDIQKASIAFAALVGMLLGGLHLLAWNFTFPTPIEGLLWKISAVSMVAAIPYVLLFRAGVVWFQRYQYYHGRMGKKTSPFLLFKFLNIYVFLSAIVGILFFAGTRLYLIVESFISIRHMSYGTFFVPRWTQVFPHV